MKRVSDHLREHAITVAGFHQHSLAHRLPDSLELRETEWSSEFEELMRARLIVGALRYGLLGSHNKTQYDRIENAILRLRKYQHTGNTETLVDAANMLLLEYVEGCHPTKHFAASDDGDHHAKGI